MSRTMEELEKRLIALEQEFARFRRAHELPANEMPGARLLRCAGESRAELVQNTPSILDQMGITGEPIGHEALMQMWLDLGIKPEDNLLSREIIAMRDEERG